MVHERRHPRGATKGDTHEVQPKETPTRCTEGDTHEAHQRRHPTRCDVLARSIGGHTRMWIDGAVPQAGVHPLATDDIASQAPKMGISPGTR